MNWEVPVPSNEGKSDKPVERAQQEFARATERLVDTAKRHAESAISDLSAAVVSGVRDVKAELHLPQTVKDHPYAWIAGGFALGAAGLMLLRGVARAAPRPVVKSVAGGGFGGRLVVTAVEIGVSYLLMRRQARKAAEIPVPEGPVALH